MPTFWLACLLLQFRFIRLSVILYFLKLSLAATFTSALFKSVLLLEMCSILLTYFHMHVMFGSLDLEQQTLLFETTATHHDVIHVVIRIFIFIFSFFYDHKRSSGGRILYYDYDSLRELKLLSQYCKIKSPSVYLKA